MTEENLARPMTATAPLSTNCFQKAIFQFERALEEDPLMVTSRGLLAWTLVAAGLYDRALVQGEKCLQIADNHHLA